MSLILPTKEDFAAHGLHSVELDSPHQLDSSSSFSSPTTSTDREMRITGTARLTAVEAYPLGERWKGLPAGEVRRVRFR